MGSMTGNVGTISYMAPELFTTSEDLRREIEGANISDGRFMEIVSSHEEDRVRIPASQRKMCQWGSVDVYAFGILLNTLCTWKLPYINLKELDLIVKLSKGHRPEMVGVRSVEDFPGHDKLRELITRCWHQRQATRPPMYKVREVLLEVYEEIDSICYK